MQSEYEASKQDNEAQVDSLKAEIEVQQRFREQVESASLLPRSDWSELI